MQLINDLGVYRSIFSVIPTSIVDTFSRTPTADDTSLKAASILHSITCSPSSSSPLPSIHPTVLKAFHSDPSCKSRLFLASALTPYLGITYHDHKGKELPAVLYVIRECLKLGTQNHFLDGVPVLFDACKVLKNPDLNKFRVSPEPTASESGSVSEEKAKKAERSAIGNLLRQKVVHNPMTGSEWTSSLLFSLVVELIPLCETIEEGLRGVYHSLVGLLVLCNFLCFSAPEATKVIETYNAFVSRVEELGLNNAVDLKHLLDVSPLNLNQAH
jgi:tRNA nucleotidyltransferase (CCA-adding enzyme)